MKKILIYEAFSPQALAISKFIKKYSSFKIIGAIEPGKKIISNSYYYDKIIVSKFENINNKNYDYLLPTGAYSTFKVVNKFQTLKYENGIKFDRKNLIAFDKIKMLEFVRDIGIPIPKTWYKIDDIEMFPVFYKENFETGGGLRGLAYDIHQIPKNNNLFYQEYIDSPFTYGFSFLAKDGNILSFTMHKEVISYPKLGGSAVVIERFWNEKLINYSMKLIKKLNYNGWGLIEYKFCNKRNDFIFMEINAKFWASLYFTLSINPNFLSYMFNINYPFEEVNKVLFLNRLCQYSLWDILKNSKHIFSSKVVKEYSCSSQIIKKLIPNKLIFLLRKYQ